MNKKKIINIGNKNAVGTHKQHVQKILVELLDKELAWCEEHKRNSPYQGSWNDGFMEGLNQAKRIIIQMDKFNPYILEK